MAYTPPVDLYSSCREFAFGIVLIGLVLGINGFTYVSVIHFFTSRMKTGFKSSKIKAQLFFVVCTQMLALIQFASIALWASFLLVMGIFTDWLSAVRFSASCYTTLGDFAVNLPDGWHLMPMFIAFSGLFSFSWAATSTISMMSSLNDYFEAN